MGKNSRIVKKIKKATGIVGNWIKTELECPVEKCREKEYVYIHDDKKTCYCITCGTEFDVTESTDNNTGEISLTFNIHDDEEMDYSDIVSDDPQTVQEALKKLESGKNQASNQTKNYKNYNASWDSHGYGFTKTCFHAPQMIIDGQEEGWSIWAGKRINCREKASQFDVILNLTSISIKQSHNIPVPELKKWENFSNKYTEIHLDWPDYGTIYLPREFWLELIEYIQKNKFKMLVFCEGGHGRTGTAMACLLVLALNYAPNKAIAWLRQHYCHDAIETTLQEYYVESMVDKSKVDDPVDTNKLLKAAEEEKQNQMAFEAAVSAVDTSGTMADKTSQAYKDTFGDRKEDIIIYD